MRSEGRRTVRKTRGSVEAPEIGPRVFPFHPPPASMPSPGTRRSTRVFVPKAAVKAAAVAAAAKPRNAASIAKPPTALNEDGDEWNGDSWWDGDAKKPGVVEWKKESGNDGAVASPPPPSTPVVEEEPNSTSPKDKMFGIVYCRKRRRPHGDVSQEDQRYGFVYARRPPPEKPHVESLTEETLGESLVIADSARSFACKAAGILEEDLCSSWGGPMVLTVLVESSCIAGSFWFSCVLLSILYWMGRPGVELWGFAAIVFSESLARFFSLQGVHFLPVKQLEFTALSRNAELGCGICMLYCAGRLVPLLTINFSAAPLCFKRLHEAVILASMYLPAALASHLNDVVRQNSHGPAESGFSATKISTFVAAPTKLNELQFSLEASEPVSGNTVSLSIPGCHHPRKKRSNLKKKVRKGIIDSLPAGSCPRRIALSEPSPVKPPDAHPCDAVTVGVDNIYSPCRPPKTDKKPRNKKLKAALSKVRKKIDEATCYANILVTDPDKSWREEDAEISLWISDSRQWCIKVEVRDVIRNFIELPDLKSHTTNSDNHAYAWAIDDRWTLEFVDEWDWLVFQELHTECRSRFNKKLASLKVIQVPGVQEVSGYDEVTTSSFRRPDIYIRSVGDEVEHALASNAANYDMDCGDEEWLKQLNSTSFDSEHGDLGHISENDFEKVIFTLEKNAYNNPDDISNKERALDLCQNLGKRDLLAAVFDYWLKKRKKKRASLVKAFQYPRKKVSHVIQNSFSRKKRPLYRQRRQGGRRNLGAIQEDAENDQEADYFACEAHQKEIIASQALQKANHLRSRAQKFMAHADLAAYKSVMALRIADIKHVSSNSQDFGSSILD